MRMHLLTVVLCFVTALEHRDVNNGESLYVRKHKSSSLTNWGDVGPVDASLVAVGAAGDAEALNGVSTNGEVGPVDASLFAVGAVGDAEALNGVSTNGEVGDGSSKGISTGLKARCQCKDCDFQPPHHCTCNGCEGAPNGGNGCSFEHAWVHDPPGSHKCVTPVAPPPPEENDDAPEPEQRSVRIIVHTGTSAGTDHSVLQTLEDSAKRGLLELKAFYTEENEQWYPTEPGLQSPYKVLVSDQERLNQLLPGYAQTAGYRTVVPAHDLTVSADQVGAGRSMMLGDLQIPTARGGISTNRQLQGAVYELYYGTNTVDDYSRYKQSVERHVQDLFAECPSGPRGGYCKAELLDDLTRKDGGAYGASIRNYFQVVEADIVIAISQFARFTPGETNPADQLNGGDGMVQGGTGAAIRFWLDWGKTDSQVYFFNDIPAPSEYTVSFRKRIYTEQQHYLPEWTTFAKNGSVKPIASLQEVGDIEAVKEGITARYSKARDGGAENLVIAIIGGTFGGSPGVSVELPEVLEHLKSLLPGEADAEATY